MSVDSRQGTHRRGRRGDAARAPAAGAAITKMTERPAILRILLPAVLGLIPACIAGQTRQPAAQSHPHPNVILITMDTLRADHVGCYGAKTVKTPALDALAADGVLFERAISQVPLTWPSHAAILTGTYPFQNGVQDFTGPPLAPQFRSVAQAFKQHGYATGAVVSAFVLDRSFGLIRGFDSYDDAFSAETFIQKDLGLVDRKAGDSVAHAIDWLQKTAQRPFFLWLHLYDPHSPYDPPEPFNTKYHDHLYDGEIAYADHELGRLIAWLKRNQLYDGSLIVFLSDHGESLGDHGEKEHGFFVYNSTTHIPLIVKPPAGRGVHPGRVSRVVETIAVAPTLLHSAGLRDEIEKQFQSEGLFGVDPKSENSAYSETFYPFSFFGWSPLHALQTSRYHYIDAPDPELYDLSTDPAEEKNLASQQSATVAVLKDKLQQRLKHNPFAPVGGDAPGLDPEAVKKLRALGYFAYRSAVYRSGLPTGLGSDLPDPKERLWEFNATLEASDAFGASDFKKGEALLREVREKDPQQYIIPFMLGEAALRQKLWERAASDLQECLRLNPSFDQAMTSLARALYQKGDVTGAQGWVDHALKLNPDNYRAWYELGLIDTNADKAAAVLAFEKSISIQPNFAMSRRDLGMLQFHQENYPEASTHLAKAIELGLHAPSLYNFLGIAYSRTNRLQDAVASYQNALKLDPNLAEAHLNLAYAYQRLGRPATAKTQYLAACRLEVKYCKFVPGHKNQ
jgi:arylsulfatase A-like enzyme/Flp pilus assembly protein TadD